LINQSGTLDLSVLNGLGESLTFVFAAQSIVGNNVLFLSTHDCQKPVLIDTMNHLRVVFCFV